MSRLRGAFCVRAAAGLFLACSLWTPVARAGAGEIIFGVTTAGVDSLLPGVGLVWLDSTNTSVINTVGVFSGVVAGHGVRGIDFRPGDGRLYAISTSASAGQLYTVNLATAALTPVGPGFTLGSSTTTRVSMDFNPMADRIRVVTGLNFSNNFRLNPDDGSLITDTPLSFAPGDVQVGGTFFSIVGIAYAGNFAGTSSTTLFAWDYFNDGLLRIGGLGGSPSPNSGLMFTVSTPGAFLTNIPLLGFDISGDTGIAYITHDDPTTPTRMGLFTRDLGTGVQSFVGWYPAGTFIGDIAVQTGARGACCNLRTGGCILASAATCNAAGLRFLGTATACSAATCPACPGDFSQNGTRDVGDIFAFLTAWFAGCP